MEENYTEQEYKGSKGFKSFFDIFESLVFAIICVVIIFTFFARLSIVEGHSMDNTLHHGDYLIVGNLFGTYTPKQGDIVVVHGDFEFSVKNGISKRVIRFDSPIVKRVIATSGQKLRIDYSDKSNGVKVYIDDELLQEDYINEFTDIGDAHVFIKDNLDENDIFEAIVPEGKAFVMGDNRNHSDDSRSIGFIDYDLIVGKAIFRVLPINKLGTV